MDEGVPGGVWKGKKAVVIRVDGSGTVEGLVALKVRRTESDTENAFKAQTGNAADGKIPWFTTAGGVFVLNPTEPQ